MYRNNILLGKLAFAFIVTFTICSMPVGFLVTSASELVSGELEGKVHCEATINENFADDRVLVVLNNVLGKASGGKAA